MKVSLTYYRLGAQVGTDLVNTSPQVRSTGEALADPAALTRFLAGHHLRPEALSDGHNPTRDDLCHVHTLRQQVRATLDATTEDHAAQAAAALVTRAGRGPILDRDADGRLQWYVVTSPEATIADEMAALIGTALLGVLRALSHDRFRHCAAPACHGMFVDTSRAGRRRYCTPDLCGNRLNVANHRARRLIHDLRDTP